MPTTTPPEQRPADEALAGLAAYLEENRDRSFFEETVGADRTWCFFLHGNQVRTGRVEANEKYEFDLRNEEGGTERIHKVHVKCACAAELREDVVRQMKREDPVSAKPEGPHFSPRYRHHIKNKTLYPLMKRKEVLFFTLLEGEVLRGIVTDFARYEIHLGMKRGVPVVIARHAVRDVRDKKGRSYLKVSVEKTGRLY